MNFSRCSTCLVYSSFGWSDTRSHLFTTSTIPLQACLIYPAKNKYQQSYIQPHLELMAQYLASLREPNTCVIVTGYGFNDDHLSEPILSAVKTNPHLRLILTDRSVDEKLSGAKPASPYWGSFKELAMKGEDIWFIKCI